MEIREPVNVNDDAFQRVIMESKIPVIVDFWAPWCGPCKIVAPILEKIAGDYAGKLLVAKVNTDENPQWSEKFQIRSIPTMLMIADGKVAHTQVGALPEGMLREVIAEFLNVVETAKSDKS